MKAMMVTVSLMTRVVVPDDFTEEQIIDAAKDSLISKLSTDLHENVEEVYEDDEVPYDKEFDK